MNKPLGGKLINRIASAKQKKALLKQDVPFLSVSREKIIELWDIATGAYSPLSGFLGEEDLRSVFRELRLTNGAFWPVPIILDINVTEKKMLDKAYAVILTDAKGKKFAHLKIDKIYPFPKREFETHIYGTHDPAHPGIKRVREAKEYLLGGDILWIAPRFSSIKPNLTPLETRAFFAKKKWKQIVGFHTRNVPHRGHEHVMREGLKQTDGLLVQPLVGRKKSGDFQNEIVAKAYRYFTRQVLPEGKALLSFLPYSAYFAGPREALLTAVIRKNFGCTHFIVGRDHTGVGNFYDAKEYARMIKKYERAMGIKIFHFGKAFYCRLCDRMAFEETCPHDKKHHVHLSGTKIRAMLASGKVPPEDMMHAELSAILLKEKDLFV